MRLLLVTYDLLGRPNYGDYQSLFDALAKLRAQRVLLSVWMLRTSSTCKQVRDYLAPHLHAEKDRLFVAEVTDWSGRCLIIDANNI